MTDRDLAMISAICSFLAVVVPIYLYRLSQKREVTITGGISGPLNKKGDGWLVPLIFEARNTGRKKVMIKAFEAKSPNRVENMQRLPVSWVNGLAEDDTATIEQTMLVQELTIEKVYHRDTTNKEWLMDRTKLAALVDEVNTMIRGQK